MKVIWAVLAEGSSVDRDTNNVSLFNVVEEMHVPAPPEPADDDDLIPGVPVRLVLMILFSRSMIGEGERHEARLVLEMPNGRVAETNPGMEVDLETANRARHRINLGMIPIAGEGVYGFRIQQSDENGDWQLMCEVPLQVNYLAE